MRLMGVALLGLNLGFIVVGIALQAWLFIIINGIGAVLLWNTLRGR